LPHFRLGRLLRQHGLPHSICRVDSVVFRRLLTRELARRAARNERYSLRAFARHLRVDHATLSQWLRGRRPITPRTVARLAPRLAGTAGAAPDFAILALTGSPDFQPDSRWIAGTLGTSVDDVNMALQRLLRLGLLQMTTRYAWVVR
jgi:transcriptional regulator with XRE-family HTH domain